MQQNPAPPSPFGVWEAFHCHDTYESITSDEQYGVFRGFVDDIALHLAPSIAEDDIIYFRPAADSMPFIDIALSTEPSECLDFVALNIAKADGQRLFEDLAQVREFFAGRPVFASYSDWGSCATLVSLKDECAMEKQKRREATTLLLARLSDEEQALLREQGFKER